MPEVTDDRREPETFGLKPATDDGWYDPFVYVRGPDGPVPTPNNSGPFSTPPRFIVMHYTATALGSGDRVADYFHDQSRTSVSAHFVLDWANKGSHSPESMRLYQCLPLTLRGHHAGASQWRGVRGLNQHSIGIEIVNYGWLNRRGDGEFEAWTGDIVAKEHVIEADHWHPGWPRYWEKYPPGQLDAAEALCRAIMRDVPSIREIVTHEMISPGRKADTGPAFPRQRFIDLVEDRSTDAVEAVRTVRVTANKLNVRGGPSVQFDTMAWGPVSRGDRLHVLGEQAGWYYVVREKHGERDGWVYASYTVPVA